MSPVSWGNVAVYEIPQYTEEEAKEVWYDEEELENISSIMWRTVQQLNDDEVAREKNQAFLEGTIDGADQCTRGLEDMTVKGSLAKLVAKYGMDLAVLEEQKNQREKGVRDEEALAQASRAESRRHISKAIALGKKDEESAAMYLNRRPQPESTTSAGETGTKKRAWFRRRKSQQNGDLRDISPGVIGGSMRRLLGMKK